MSLKALLILPLLAGFFACMQVPGPAGEDGKGQGECDEEAGVRIGGTSVGCGNPIKSVALNPISLCGEVGSPCGGLLEDYPVTVSLGDGIGIRIRFKGDTSIPNPFRDTTLRFGEPKAVLRYDGQVFPMDSIPLGVFLFADDDSLKLDFKAICDSLDNPDRVCSESIVTEIPISFEVLVPVLSGSQTFIFRATIQGIVANTRQGKLSWAGGGDLGQDIMLQATFGWAEATVDSSFFDHRDSLFGWLLYVPGTDIYSMVCKGNGTAQFQGLVRRALEVRAVPIPIAWEAGWQPVYQLDSLHSDPMFGDNSKVMSLHGVVDSLRIPESFYESQLRNYCLAE
jgi:hypothetical protein